jgi:Trk-type K+ transport systems, membrane components
MSWLRHSHKVYESKRRLHIAQYKGRVRRILQVCSVIVSLVTIACIIFYHGFYISIDAKNLIRWITYGSLLFYICKYFILLFYSLHRKEFIRRSWFEFIVICLLIIQFLSVVIFHFRFVSAENFENYYILFVQVYFLVMVLIEMAKMSSTIGKYSLSPPLLMVLSFLILISFGTVLLLMPRMTYDGISFIDALFTATSASCITGLSVVSTSGCFTVKGQIVIMLLIQLGGMSILSFATFFTTFLARSSVGLRYQYMVRDMMATKLSDSFSLLRSIVLTTFIIEAVGVILLYTYWKNTGFFTSSSENLFFSLFYTISAFNNGGFVLIDKSLLELGSAHSYFPQVIIMILVFLGGIGFLTIRDFFSPRYIRDRKKYPWKSLMPQTKIILITTLGLIFVCTVLFFFIERNNALAGQGSLFDKIFTAFFEIATCRTSGFMILDINSMALPSVILIIVLMFIGGSPSSTGGGIKTTTFFVLIKSVWATIQGKKHIEFQHKTISYDLVDRASSIVTMTFSFILVSVFMLTLVEPSASLKDAIFETTSAFATCGLSTGICAEWNTLAKTVLIFDMYIGRIGTLTLAFALTRHKKESQHQYPDLYLMVG